MVLEFDNLLDLLDEHKTINLLNRVLSSNGTKLRKTR